MIRWTTESINNEALNFKTRNEYQKKSSSSYASAKLNNWFDEITSHMPKVQNNNKNSNLKYE